MRILFFIFLIGFSALLQAGQFTVDKNYEIVARELLEQLPNYAADRLIEAERKTLGWKYSFYIDYDKTWVHVAIVEISRNKENANLTDILVIVKEKTGGLIKSKTKMLTEQSVEWEGKVKEILKSE